VLIVMLIGFTVMQFAFSGARGLPTISRNVSSLFYVKLEYVDINL